MPPLRVCARAGERVLVMVVDCARRSALGVIERARRTSEEETFGGAPPSPSPFLPQSPPFNRARWKAISFRRHGVQHLLLQRHHVAGQSKLARGRDQLAQFPPLPPSRSRAAARRSRSRTPTPPNQNKTKTGGRPRRLVQKGGEEEAEEAAGGRRGEEEATGASRRRRQRQ